MKGFSRIDRRGQADPELPRLDSPEKLWGWTFDCFFAEWPVYLPFLFRWYEELGGAIEIAELTPESLNRMEGTIVNCLGLGSRFLFDDPAPHRALKGHLVRVADAPPIQTESGKTISYNYNPKREKYADAEGNSQDLYCYSRSDGWILGGSRLEGTIGPDGTWRGTEPEGPLVDVGGIGVPEPILALNDEILSHSYGISMNRYTDRTAKIGYRYIRDQDEGLRLEQVRMGNRRIIHNYGHGGAGVTLSWGCALRIARWIRAETRSAPDVDLEAYNARSEALFRHLRRLVNSSSA
ncbi:MAG: FAD-dependent oxidoreductase [Balneolaceae bacterium]|nr:FAD-dependent oxidoreductase [Balneolaceae bacterium]